jgi:L-asparaginase II
LSRSVIEHFICGKQSAFIEDRHQLMVYTLDKEGKELFLLGRNPQKITLAGGKKNPSQYHAESPLGQ